MLKLTFSDDISVRDSVHMRHLMQALAAHPEVRTHDTGEGVDFAVFGRLGRSQNQGREMVRADRTLRIWRQDPQTAVSDIGVDALIEPDMLNLLLSTEEGRDFHDGFLSENLMSLADNWPSGTCAADMDQFDFVGITVTDPWDNGVLQQLKLAQPILVPMSVPWSIFHSDGSEQRDVDVFWLGVLTYFYPLRMQMSARLAQLASSGDVVYHQAPLKTLDVPWLKLAKRNPRLWDDHQLWYADQLRASKAMCFCGSIFNYPVQKYFECMACGCLVVAPLPRNAGLLGFEDGVNMVAVTADTWEDRLRYYLDHDAERDEITANARDLVRRRFTCEASAGHLVEKLSMIRDGYIISDF